MAYVFDPSILQAVVNKSIPEGGGDSAALIEALISNLAEEYPDQINTQQEWVFSVTGSAVLQMTMLHVSLSEYLLLESYPIPMSCFTGRFNTTVYEFIASGREELFRTGEFEAQPLGAGDSMVMQPRDAACVRVIEPLISVEYARGFIPGMFSLPLVDTMFGTLDYKTLFKTIVDQHKADLAEPHRPAPGWKGRLTARPPPARTSIHPHHSKAEREPRRAGPRRNELSRLQEPRTSLRPSSSRAPKSAARSPTHATPQSAAAAAAGLYALPQFAIGERAAAALEPSAFAGVRHAACAFERLKGMTCRWRVPGDSASSA